jgi:hypothetical protein
VIAVIGLARAGELPWECPVVTTAEEAKPYDTDAGIDALLEKVRTEIASWWELGRDGGSAAGVRRRCGKGAISPRRGP